MLQELQGDGSASSEFSVINFISKHAKNLEVIHLGPFSDSYLDWFIISEETRVSISRLLANAQEIILEGISNIPMTFMLDIRAVKTLDISDVILSRTFPVLGKRTLPSPTSLAVHTGISGAAAEEEEWCDMAGFLDTIKRRKVLDFSNLTTLYLHLLNTGDRNSLIREVLYACSKTLQNLRLYIWHEEPRDNRVIRLDHLTSLKSLYLTISMPEMEDALVLLAKTVDTISIPQTHLKELVLLTDLDYPYDDWLEDLPIHLNSEHVPWNYILNAKISQLCQQWDDIRVTLQFPPRSPLTPGSDPVVDEFLGIVLPALSGSHHHPRDAVHEGRVHIKSIMTLRDPDGFSSGIAGKRRMYPASV
ncbi:hypothetical protein AX15_000743 [Amanita polypyramis BW_CC]|nr:hypothetical protein AX15_000743 [Amanita polypyramis BW_CC]